MFRHSLAADTAHNTDPTLIAGLTEREILLHVGLGASNEEIPQALSISPATVRTYVSRLLAKFAARDRAHLVIIADESGLITPGQTQRIAFANPMATARPC